MNSKKIFWLLLLFVASGVYAEKRNIDNDWSFYLGDLENAQSLDYDDSEWSKLNIPHDWAFENGYHRDGAQKDRGGYACGGVGWYRKIFRLNSDEQASSRLFLDFDAVYRNAQVWLNGHYLGKCPYGYVPFSYDITPFLKQGENLIAVRVDNTLEPSARWYHGCGIFGSVFLRSHGNAYFDKDATYISYLDNQGEVEVETFIKQEYAQQAYLCQTEISDFENRVWAREMRPLSAGKNDSLHFSLTVPAPVMWSPERPVLYTMTLKIIDAEQKVVDQQKIRFGFRDFDWDVERGFFLNGQQYKLKGVCEHLEGGPAGAICTPQLMRWKLQLLKNMGCNAIRTAHNPQLPYFYDLCDEMGFLVMDEVFDGWRKKAEHDYGRYDFTSRWEADLRSVIRRDRNHPSVFLYSVGNETSGELAADLVRVCHEVDPSRKVTSGSAASEQMDILGMNGRSEAKSFLDTYQPQSQPFVATENPHTWQVRGFYRSKTWYRDGYKPEKKQAMLIPDLTEKEIFNYDWISPEKKSNRKQVFNSSYDNATVRVTARHMIAALRDNEWFSGSFRWTGFDYLGEAGYVHGGWPFRAFQSGVLDLAGFPKDTYYLYQSEWGDADMVHLLPHWTHPMMKSGTMIPVWVYTSGEEVELFLNGKSLGRKSKGSAWNEIQCEFMVPWTPGVIEAVAYRQGKEIARCCQRTANAPSRLGVSVENEHLAADGRDVSIISVRQEDENGTLYPYGENRVHVYVDGPARVLSFENGSPVDTTCNFNATSRCCFFGLNRIFIQSAGGKEETPVSVVLAAISGDKKLKQSNRVAINTCTKFLRGHGPGRELEVFYTTDGNEPTRESQRYQTPFPVAEGTEVRAAVFDGNQLLMHLSECFGQQEGLYWGPSGDVESLSGDQTEKMALRDCQVYHDGKNVRGGAYVVPVPGKGRLDWYQENDGETMAAKMYIRYSQQSGSEHTVMKLYHNDKLVRTIQFEDTGSTNAHWQEKGVKIRLLPGANHFSLRSSGKKFVPSLDQIRID